MVSSGSPHVRCTAMGRACGGPDEIELTAMGVELNVSGENIGVSELKGIASDPVDEHYLPMGANWRSLLPDYVSRMATQTCAQPASHSAAKTTKTQEWGRRRLDVMFAFRGLGFASHRVATRARRVQPTGRASVRVCVRACLCVCVPVRVSVGCTARKPTNVDAAASSTGLSPATLVCLVPLVYGVPLAHSYLSTGGGGGVQRGRVRGAGGQHAVLQGAHPHRHFGGRRRRHGRHGPAHERTNNPETCAGV